MADMRAGGSTETQPRTSSSHTCTSHCTPSRRRLTRYRRTGAGGTAGEAIVASDDNRLSGGAGVAAAADDVAVRHNQRPARRRCETTTRQSAATQVARGQAGDACRHSKPADVASTTKSSLAIIDTLIALFSITEGFGNRLHHVTDQRVAARSEFELHKHVSSVVDAAVAPLWLVSAVYVPCVAKPCVLVRGTARR